MSDTYAKLFHSILTSSIWSEDDKTRIMWVTMLALSDKDGYVCGTIPGLAAMARMSVADAEQAVGRLEQPDKYSRTPDYEGRRIELTDGGWHVLNFVKYREIGTSEVRRSKTAERVARFRERKKLGCNANVTESNGCVTQSPIPYTLSSIDICTDEEGGCKGGSAKPEKKPHGEFGNVKLTDDEHAKLTAKHGAERLTAGIEMLGDWLKSTGKRRSDHYACLKESSWVWQRLAEAAGKQPATGPRDPSQMTRSEIEARAKSAGRTPDEWVQMRLEGKL